MQQTLLHGEEEEVPVCACCTSKRLKYSSCCLSLLGLGLVLCAAFIPGLIQSKLESGITDFVSLAPDAMNKSTEGFRTWSNWADDDALPIYQSVYIYNITNPYEILTSNTTGAKPNLTEHGPYVYREFKIKFDFVYGQDYDNRQTLQFKEWIYWEFQRDQTDMSLNPDTDTYTNLNYPFLAVSNALGSGFGLVWPGIEKKCPGQYATDFDKLFTTTTTVTQLMFGYSDGCITNLIPADGISPAGVFPGLLGWNVPQTNVTNSTVVGPLLTPDQIYTGDDDGDYMRQYHEWKAETYLTVTPLGGQPAPLWGSAEGNRVYGTDGSQFKRNVKENSTVNAWVDDIMRHVPLLNVDSTHADAHGIDLLRYTLDPKILLNSTVAPENAPFYMNIEGLLDISKTKEGLPIFMSKPHFLDAAPWLLDDVIGLQPDRDLHDTTLDVEPLTGATMRANKRLQVNLHIQPMVVQPFLAPEEVFYATVGNHYIPSVWINENGEISSSKASDFKSSVYGAQDAIKYVHLLGSIIGSVFLGVATLMYFSAISRSASEQRVASGGGINDRY